MSDLFVMCTREVKGDKFSNEPGPTRFLRVPSKAKLKPGHEVKPGDWFKQLRKASVWGKDSRDQSRERGDVLFFVHGYNSEQEIVMARHLQLRDDLAAIGFKGEVVAFDWPSAGMAMNYLEDRHDAKKVAMQLVDDGIRALARLQTPDCSINVHLLGHSTGAYVIREAFDDADDARLDNSGWQVSQVVFIGADVSAGSMGADSASTEALYLHCTRLTNYSNLADSVLKLSNAKRIGMAPRVGRVGLPGNAPGRAVNVDCTRYFQRLAEDPALRSSDQVREIGSFDHSWHIGNRLFTRDLFETLKGDFDRSVFPTRALDAGRLHLQTPVD